MKHFLSHLLSVGEEQYESPEELHLCTKLCQPEVNVLIVQEWSTKCRQEASKVPALLEQGLYQWEWSAK